MKCFLNMPSLPVFRRTRCLSCGLCSIPHPSDHGTYQSPSVLTADLSPAPNLAVGAWRARIRYLVGPAVSSIQSRVRHMVSAQSELQEEMKC